MKNEQKEELQEFAKAIFQKKKDRRKLLAKLSFEEKIDIMVRMQNLASEISLQSRGTFRKPWWKVAT